MFIGRSISPPTKHLGMPPPESLDTIAWCNFQTNYFPSDHYVCPGYYDVSNHRRRLTINISWRHMLAVISGLLRLFVRLLPFGTRRQTQQPSLISKQRSEDSMTAHKKAILINEQSESLFFNLPLEIRCIVYEMVMCDRPVHLWLHRTPQPPISLRHPGLWNRESPWKISHNVRKFSEVFFAGPEQPPGWQRIHGTVAAVKAWRELERKQSKVSTTLFWTCRRVYLEASKTFYQKTSCVLRSDLLARHMSSIFSPIHVSTLRSLELVLDFSFHHEPTTSIAAKKSYEALWQSFTTSKLPALRSLRVIINPERRIWFARPDIDVFRQAWIGPVRAFAASRPLDFLEFASPKSHFERLHGGLVNTLNFNVRRIFSGSDFDAVSSVSSNFGGISWCRLSFQSYAHGDTIHRANCRGCIGHVDGSRGELDGEQIRLLDEQLDELGDELSDGDTWPVENEVGSPELLLAGL
ncbi:hypothetical protein FH972_022632 [Carpinus fangiana]|uniref:DUF7730 domain-containing protein n=1 Tax=Carpinus fangiana TaxID=176857 RepID=A0A5N6KSS7_9ROSI|nr:hypothetical protein FH972_022632 [Carpinus fangiana]